MKLNKKHEIPSKACTATFEELPKFRNCSWISDSDEQIYKIVGIFTGYDGNWWIAIVDNKTFINRQLLLYAHFIDRYKIVIEDK